MSIYEVLYAGRLYPWYSMFGDHMTDDYGMIVMMAVTAVIYTERQVPNLSQHRVYLTILPVVLSSVGLLCSYNGQTPPPFIVCKCLIT
jgi:hypothetical protein